MGLGLFDIGFPFSSLLIGIALRWNLTLLHGQDKSISYFSFSPLYVKSPPHRITSHHVTSSGITLGQIPAGHSYEKTNLSPFSMPSLPFPAFPSIAASSNFQSSTTHFFIISIQFRSFPTHSSCWQYRCSTPEILLFVICYLKFICPSIPFCIFIIAQEVWHMMS